MKLKDPKKVPLEKNKIDNATEDTQQSNFYTDEIVMIDDPEQAVIEDPDLFYFTNASNENWTTQWAKVKYTFPANKTVRLIIKNATPYEVQGIRKAFAKRFARDQFMKGNTFNSLNKVVNGAVASYNENLLQPWIDQCLTPLPKDRIKIEEIKDNPDSNFKVSKAVSKEDNLNEMFRKDADEIVSNSQL